MNGLYLKLSQFSKSNALFIHLFAFIIPLNPKWLSIGIILIILEQLIRFQFNSFTKIVNELTLKKTYIWFIILYVLHFVGLWNTNNIDFAWMDIGMKSSFIILPLLFIVFPIKLNWIYFRNLFILGSMISILIGLTFSSIKYYETGRLWYFTESYLSYFMHRSYWSAYLLLSYIFIFHDWIIGKLQHLYAFLMLFVLFCAIILAGSKIIVLILLISTIILLIRFFIFTGRWKLGIVIFFISIGILLTLAISLPTVTGRFTSTLQKLTTSKQIDKTSTESTTARILMWETASELIKENFWSGVGTGDIKDELKKRNFKKGNIGVAERNLNAHNQFLNTHLALGITGLFTLIMIFLTSFIFTHQPKFLNRLIIFVLFCSLIVESFLETQAGIIPVTFILCILSINRNDSLNL